LVSSRIIGMPPSISHRCHLQCHPPQVGLQVPCLASRTILKSRLPPEMPPQVALQVLFKIYWKLSSSIPVLSFTPLLVFMLCCKSPAPSSCASKTSN
jgi:hypothetical protein